MKPKAGATSDEKTLDYYMALSYPMELHEDDGAFTALYPDLPGCMSYGETLDEAVSSLKRTKRLWISGRLEADMAIPMPTESESFSGKFIVRVPKSLHRQLHDEARRDGVSLNQYITHVLSCRHHASNNLESIEAACDRVLSSLGKNVLPPKQIYGGMHLKQVYDVHAESLRDWDIDFSFPNVGLLKSLPHPMESFCFSESVLMTPKRQYLERGR